MSNDLLDHYVCTVSSITTSTPWLFDLNTEFSDMTKRLQMLKISESSYTVLVKPEIVVEVAYNEIQHSARYKSGFALRFARITRIRSDKGPFEIETMNRIRESYEL